MENLPWIIGSREIERFRAIFGQDVSSEKAVEVIKAEVERIEQVKLDKKKAIEASQELTRKSAQPLDSWMTTLVDSFMILGLMLSTDSIWVFPLEALKHGGYFFLVIYFFISLALIVPLLHLEIFVSQICQSGIIRAMQLHGAGYAGVGIGIVVLTIMRHIVGLHRGYYYLINILNIYDDAETPISCKSIYVKNISTCVSIYVDILCSRYGFGNYFINDTCQNTTSFPENVVTAATSYTDHLLSLDQQSMDFTVIFLQLSVLYFLSFIGVKVLRLLIAAIYVVTMMFYATAVINFPYDKTLETIRLVAAYSNPRVLFETETYTAALRLAVSSAGLCVCGIFCASSFRRRNANSYLISWIAFVCNYMSCLMSVFALVVLVALMNKERPGAVLSFSVYKQGLAFAAATIPEFFGTTHLQFSYVMVLYFAGSYMINWSYSFAAFLVIHSVLRDHFASWSKYSFNVMVLLVYCTITCIYYVGVTWQLSHGIHSVEEEAVKFSIHLYIFMMIIIFVYIYGIHELEIDMVSLHGEYEGFLAWGNVAKSLPTYNYCFFLMIVLQIMESTRISRWMQFTFWHDETTPRQSEYGYANLAAHLIIVTPVLIPFLYLLYKVARLKKYEKFTKLFDVTPEHPAYIRINSRAILGPVDGRSMPSIFNVFILSRLKNSNSNSYTRLRGEDEAISCARHLPSDTDDEEDLPDNLSRFSHKENEDMKPRTSTECLLMKPKRLEWMLSEMRSFQNPNVKLEQYATSPELAISIVDSIDRLVGLDGRFVADLGCGCGMLMSTIALAYQPAAVVGMDIDEYALSICRENLEDLEVDYCCDVVKADVLQLSAGLHGSFDVVIMNPPFGTKKNAGMDMRFVRAGLMMLRPGGSLFSLHKTSTRDYILKTANKWNDADARCIAELRWNLDSTYKFHKKKSVDIAVDLIHYKKV